MSTRIVLAALALLMFACGCVDQSSYSTTSPVAEGRDIPKPQRLEIAKAPEAAKIRKELAGQIFIVTRGHETIKLSLANVRIFPSSYVRESSLKIVKYHGELLDWLIARRIYGDGESEAVEREAWAIWKSLEPAAVEATCDADGRFQINADLPEQFCVVAQSSREVFGKTEYYTWTIYSDKIANPKEIFLTNENLN